MKKIIYLITLFASVMQAQVGIGTTAPKGALDINADLPAPSTDQAGFVPPIVGLTATNSFNTTTSTIINPNGGAVVTGTIVYNTATSAAGPNQVTPGYYFYNGTVWEKLGSGAASGTDWSINGNAGTDETTNFIGTPDDSELVFKTDNVERLRMTTNGRIYTNQFIGIGTQTPTAHLEIDASTGTTPPFEIVPSSAAPTGTTDGQMAIMDGSLFIYDTARGKWLSSETMIFTFGRNGNFASNPLGYGGAQNINSGAKILKNATIVGITAQSSNASTKQFSILATTFNIFSFPLVGGTYSNSNPAVVNLDIDTGEFISVNADAAGTNVNNPTVTLYVKWRQ